MYHVILKHDDPKELPTHRRRAFLTRVVSEILRLCSMLHKPTPAHHPRTNELSKPLNRTLANRLSMYVYDDHTDWYATLTFITSDYNSARQDTIRFSPFYAYERKPALLINYTLLLPPDSTLTGFTSETVHHAEDARQLSRQRTLDSQQRQCTRYNGTH